MKCAKQKPTLGRSVKRREGGVLRKGVSRGYQSGHGIALFQRRQQKANERCRARHQTKRRHILNEFGQECRMTGLSGRTCRRFTRPRHKGAPRKSQNGRYGRAQNRRIRAGLRGVENRGGTEGVTLAQSCLAVLAARLLSAPKGRSQSRGLRVVRHKKGKEGGGRVGGNAP